MDPLDTLAAGIKHVDGLLDEDALEPDAARTDWDTMKVRVRMAREGLDNDVLAVLDDALGGIEEDAVRTVLKRRVAVLLGAIGAMLEASGDATGALDARGRAREIAVDDEQRAEIDAGDAEPRAWTRLHHARWLFYRQRRSDAERAAKEVVRTTKEDALRKGARAILNAPRPLDSAPALFRLNGCGVGLYGDRDRTDDGWYVATYCICLLFIPVFPLTAYRVRQTSDNAYQFVAREALSPIARAWQLAIAAVAVIAIGYGGVTSYLDSPERKARVALEEARGVEAKGDRQAALERYTALLRDHTASAEVAAAAEAVIRLGAAAVPDPCTAGAIDKVARVVAALDGMPPGGRAIAAPLLVKRLEGWADQIGDGSVEQANAALTVLDMAAKIAAPGGATIAARRGKLRRALADKVVATRPLQALALYAQPPADPGSLVAAAKIVEGLGEAPSLWIEAEHDVALWAYSAERHPDLDAAAKQARARIHAAHEARAASEPLLANGDEKQLAAALASSPGNQEIAVALAQILRRKGDAKAALATLDALGAPGRMTATAQRLFAACHADAGDLAKAQAILEALLAERLPAFQQAQRDFEGAADRAQRQIMADLKRGVFDAELGPKVQGLSEAEKGNVFREWLSAKIRDDAQLKALRVEYLRHDAVVPTSLALGQIELRRANASSGAEKRALLAVAEKTFLSIQAQAEGDPTYHLGLGQVYHRLGRAEEGNAELARLLARKNPELSFAVAHVYRDLGLAVRAKQIAEELWSSSAEQRWKQEAAELLSHLVNEVGFNEDEEEMWLKRSDPSSQGVKHLLLRLEARRLHRQGKLEEADRAHAKLIEAYERNAATNGTAANNAAVAYQERYRGSGDLAHLRAAVKHMEAAHRLSPQNAIVAGNLSESLAQLGMVTVLDRWIRTKVIAPTSDGSRALLGEMLDGPLRDEVLAALRKDPSIRRSLDVAVEEQALAPQKSSGYERQITWLSWNDDANALVEMSKRLAAMPPFDASALAEGRRVRREGTKDALTRAMLAQNEARAEDTVRRAERTGHAPTLAAARLLLATQRASVASMEPTKERLDAMIEPARQAAQGWAESGAEDTLALLLAMAALERAGAESPAIGKLLAADRRIYGTTALIHRALGGPDGAAALEALRKQPEMLEAARLRKPRTLTRPRTLDVVLARIAGDAEMERSAAAVFDRASVGASIAIEATMAPGQEAEQYELDVWKTRGKPR